MPSPASSTVSHDAPGRPSRTAPDVPLDDVVGEVFAGAVRGSDPDMVAFLDGLRVGSPDDWPEAA